VIVDVCQWLDVTIREKDVFGPVVDKLASWMGQGHSLSMGHAWGRVIINMRRTHTAKAMASTKTPEETRWENRQRQRQEVVTVGSRDME
jgi:hypothetical protein